MLLDFSNLNEEPLKSSVAKAFFENFDFSGDKIDFIIITAIRTKASLYGLSRFYGLRAKKVKASFLNL
ncbi:hypothetical protein ACLGBS_07445 [Helicobacter pylori]